jgi:hypothetical protein
MNSLAAAVFKQAFPTLTLTEWALEKVLFYVEVLKCRLLKNSLQT